MTINTALKLRIVAFVFILLGGILVSRLYFLQIVQGSAYRERADHRYPAEYLFDRGSIFFKTNNEELVAAATLKTSYFIYFNPSLTKNPDDIYQALAPMVFGYALDRYGAQAMWLTGGIALAGFGGVMLLKLEPRNAT